MTLSTHPHNSAQVLEPFRRTDDPSALEVNLEALDLRDLSPLVPRLAAMPRLRRLSVAGNRLGALPGDLSKLSALRTLDLTRNMFSKIDSILPSLQSLPSLRELSVTVTDQEEEQLILALPNLEVLNGVSLQENEVHRPTPLPHAWHSAAGGVQAAPQLSYQSLRPGGARDGASLNPVARPANGEFSVGPTTAQVPQMPQALREREDQNSGAGEAPAPDVSLAKRDLESLAMEYQRVKSLAGVDSEQHSKMARAFEKHVQTVIFKLNERLQTLESPTEQHSEVLMAKHGLYDICFQETIKYVQGSDPQLGDVLKRLCLVHSELFQTFDMLVTSTSRTGKKLRARLSKSEQETNQLLEASRKLEEQVLEHQARVHALETRLQQAQGRLHPTTRGARAEDGMPPKPPPPPPPVGGTTKPTTSVLHGATRQGNHHAQSQTPPRRGTTRPGSTRNSKASLQAKEGYSSKNSWREHRGGPSGPTSVPAARASSEATIDEPATPSVQTTTPWFSTGQLARSRAGTSRVMLDDATASYSIRNLSLKQLKDFIEQIYASKDSYDTKCEEHGLVRETMEQHMYNFLNKRFGLKKLVVETATAILKAVHRYEMSDGDVQVFSKIFRNDIDEEFRQVHLQLEVTIGDLLLSQLREKHRFRSDGEIHQKLREKQAGSLSVDEWEPIVQYMYNQEDAETLCSMVRVASKCGSRIFDASSGRGQPGTPTGESGGGGDAQNTGGIEFVDFLHLVQDFQLQGHDRFLARFRELFRQLDADGDGVINENEFLTLVPRINPQRTAQEASDFFQQADSHGVGKVTFSEAVAVLSGDIVDMMLNFTRNYERRKEQVEFYRLNR